jgi:hypothetical protein
MRTAIGIVLFVVVYAPIAYMVYDQLTGRRSRVQTLVERGAHLPRRRRRAQLTSRYQ